MGGGDFAWRCPSPAPCALVAVQTKRKTPGIIINNIYFYIYLYLPLVKACCRESPKVRAADHAFFLFDFWSTDLPQISFFCVCNVLNNLSQESAAARISLKFNPPPKK